MWGMWVRTYSWRRYQHYTKECYERQTAEGCPCGAEGACACEAEGQVVGGPCRKCTRAAAGENGR